MTQPVYDNPPRSVFMVAVYNRYELCARSLASLVRSRLPEGTMLLLVDDASSDERIGAHLRSLTRGPARVEILTLPERTGRPFHVFNAGLEYLQMMDVEIEGLDWIGWGDPDMIYAPDWFLVGRTALEAAQAAPCAHVRDLGVRPAGFTAFDLGPRADRHGYVCTEGVAGDGQYRIKRFATWCNVVFEGAAFAKCRGRLPACRRAEAAFGVLMRRAGICLVGTVPAYVQHAGATESALYHHRRGTPDVASDFAGDPMDAIPAKDTL